MSPTIKPAHLTLTPHHLFYLLSRLEDLDISVGPMNVRLETIHNDSSHANYVSFLQNPKPGARQRGDRDSLHSVSSVRSVMSSMSSFWSSIGLGHGASRSDKAKAAIEADLKYLYSAFTKLPSLRLSPDHRARLIKGYEEFPFDTAVPLFAFKNLQQLDIIDVDFRQFHGWDRLAEQLTLLTVKRANVDDPADLITNIVLDDAERRRRRSTKSGGGTPGWTVPSTPRSGFLRSNTDPTFFTSSPESPESGEQLPIDALSPQRLTGRPQSSYRHIRTYSSKIKRSGSGSSDSSENSSGINRLEVNSSLLSANVLSPNKWLRLKYLSLADNSLTAISAKSILPLANSLRSLNLSSNLFTEIPDSLASLTRLNSLDLSNCMIESLHSLTRSPLPAITTIKLRSNRLRSLAGVERLLSLENLNVQDNQLSDPMEAARLTSIPNLRRIWVKHNRFTKKCPDYRVTIFNLFRSTPGYTDDLIIDDYSPSYSERKCLLERVPELERPPVTQPIGEPELDITPPAVLQPPARPVTPNLAPADAHVQPMPRPKPLSTQSELTANSSRRRRGPRRRIVDLSSQDSFARNLTFDMTAEEPTKEVARTIRHKEKPTPKSDADAVPKPDEIQRSNFEVAKSSDGTRTVIVGMSGIERNSDGMQNGEDYRERVEALRKEFGNNWISVLSERGWEAGRDQDKAFSTPSPMVPRANSQAIVSSGRTLG